MHSGFLAGLISSDPNDIFAQSRSWNDLTWGRKSILKLPLPDDVLAIDVAFTEAVCAATRRLVSDGCDATTLWPELVEIVNAFEPLHREGGLNPSDLYATVDNVLAYVAKEVAERRDRHEVVGLISVAIDCRFEPNNGFFTILELLQTICVGDQLVDFHSELGRLIKREQEKGQGNP